MMTNFVSEKQPWQRNLKPKKKKNPNKQIGLSKSKIPVHCEYWHDLGKNHHRTSKQNRKMVKKRKAERKGLLLNKKKKINSKLNVIVTLRLR